MKLVIMMKTKQQQAVLPHVEVGPRAGPLHGVGSPQEIEILLPKEERGSTSKTTVPSSPVESRPAV